MATRQWLGIAPARTEVWTATVGGTIEVGDKFAVACNGVEIIAAVATTTTIATTCTDIATAWNASTHPYATMITATTTSTTVIFTADISGWPFTLTVSTRETNDAAADAQTFTMAGSATVAATGPNFASNAFNWSGATLPITGDTVVFRDSAVNVCWGLNQSAVVLAAVQIHQSYTGKIGLDSSKLAVSADGSTTVTGATEYRDTYLRYGFTATTGSLEIGLNDSQSTPPGSGRIMIDCGSNNFKITIHNTAAASSETGRPAVRLKTNGTSNEMVANVKSAPGGFGIGVDRSDETGLACNTITIADSTTASKVFTGNGVAVTTWTQNGGINVLRSSSDPSLITGYGGILTMEGGYLAAAISNQGATIYPNNVKVAGGVCATAIFTEAGLVDMTKSNRARIVSTWIFGNTGIFKYDKDVVTIAAYDDGSLDGPITASFTD